MTDYKPPKGHDKHLSDGDRAHTGEPGAKVRHGADALNRVSNSIRNKQATKTGVSRTQMDREMKEVGLDKDKE